MRIVLCSWTALEIWRKLSHQAPALRRVGTEPRPRPGLPASRLRSLDRCASSAARAREFGLLERMAGNPSVSWDPASREVEGFDPLPLAPPVHVLVPGGSKVTRSSEVVLHSWSGALPAGSLFVLGTSALLGGAGSTGRAATGSAAATGSGAIGGEVLLSSPELAFVQVAEELSSGVSAARRRGASPDELRSERDAALVRLILLGMELCGTYATSPAGTPWDASATVYRRRPLASVGGIRRLLDDLTPAHRPRLATRAVERLADHAASPMETALYLLLTLPRRLGGYGLPRPILNRRIQVAARFRSLTGRAAFVPDLYWPDVRLDLEYDSKEFHDAEDSFSDTLQRDNTLKTIGIASRSVTRQVIESTELTHQVVLQCARVLGVRVRPVGDAFRARRARLRSLVLPPDTLHEQ